MLNEVLKVYQERLQVFADERDWNQFHSIKNLTMSLGIECSELMEHFQWVNTSYKKEDLSDLKQVEVEDELVDILIYWLKIADKLDMNIEDSFERKFKKNQEKYPIEKAKGSFKKYTEY